MKLIERFFGKKEEIPTHLLLNFNELPAWIDAESKNFFNDLGSHIKQKYGEISEALEDISVSRDQLIEAKFGEKVYVRMAKAGASNRENVVKNLNIIIDRIVIPEDSDPFTASEFYSNAKSILKTSLENAIRSQQYVKRLFPEEYKNILLDLKHLDTILDELIHPVNEVWDTLKLYNGLPEKIELINHTQQQIEIKRQSIQELDNKKESFENDLPLIESELVELEKSNEFIKAQELETQVKILEDQISAIDSNVKELFAPLSKALSRVEKQDESGRHTLSSQSRKVLKILIEDPVSALKTDITPFITELKSRVEDGNLGLKQQKKIKTIEQINKLTDSDILPSLEHKRDSKCSRLARLSEELKGLTVYREKTRLNKQISDCRGRIDSTNRESDNERQDLERLIEEVETLRAELNSNLSKVFKMDIEVVY